jgi:hypothetical protein
MTFHWQGQPVVNPAVRYPSDKENPRDEFGICQNDYDGLRQIFDRALSTNKPCAWDSIEPDTSIAIYPGTAWPFCDRGLEDFYDSEHPIEYWLSKENDRLTEAAKPNGLWTVMLFIDTENFREGDCITGDGVALTISTDRQEIERFRRELEIEYEEFSNRIGYREPVLKEKNG